MTRFGWTAPVLIVSLLVGAPARLAGRRAPFTLAVLRQDGILIPFASFDGRWRNTWPAPGNTIDVPITLDDVPDRWWADGRTRADWMLYAGDDEPRPLRAAAPAWFLAQCQANIGLKTDYTPPGPLPGPDAAPYPKAGLAVAGPTEIRPAIEPITVVDESHEDWQTVLHLIDTPVRASEDQEIKRRGGLWSVRSLPRDLRVETPLTLEALYRAADEPQGTVLYYFEAARRYDVEAPTHERIEGQPKCNVITYAWGWVRRHPDGATDTKSYAVLSDCYRWNVSFMLPLGVLRMKDEPPLWVVQSSGWRGEAYFVVEVRKSAEPRTLIETRGGYCL
jgi:hypothetical protein